MKLAILGSRGFPSTYGGYETLVRHVARAWVCDGHEVTVYCRSRPSARRVWWVDGVRCVWTPGLDSKRLSTLSFGLSGAMDAVFREFDAILVLNIANGVFLPVFKWRGTTTVVNVDGVEWERGKWGTIARSMFALGARATARSSARLVADSEAIASLWVERFHVRPTFIPYGARIVEARQCAQLDGLGLSSRTYVLVVARLVPENNVELALDALDLLRVRPPIVIVGTASVPSPLESRLRDEHRRGRLLWLGHVSDQEWLEQLWAHAGVYVHGHSVGGTNPALLQALGAGAPTLALRTPYNREVVEADEQLFERDPAELAQRVEQVLSSEDLQSSWALRGRVRVRDRYDWDDVSRRYLDALATKR